MERIEVLPFPHPPIPVFVRREEIHEKVVMHEFEVEEYETETGYAPRLPFRKTDVNFQVEGEFLERAVTRLTVIEGHGWLRPAKVKKYPYRFTVPRNGILKSCSSRHCITTITVRGVSYSVEDGYRTLNVRVRAGDVIDFVFENPAVEMKIGVSTTIIEYLGVSYEDIVGQYRVK